MSWSQVLCDVRHAHQFRWQYRSDRDRREAIGYAFPRVPVGAVGTLSPRE